MFWSSPEEEYVIIILGNKKSMSVYEIHPIIEIMEGKKNVDEEVNGQNSDTL